MVNIKSPLLFKKKTIRERGMLTAGMKTNIEITKDRDVDFRIRPNSHSGKTSTPIVNIKALIVTIMPMMISNISNKSYANTSITLQVMTNSITSPEETTRKEIIRKETSMPLVKRLLLIYRNRIQRINSYRFYNIISR